MTMVAAQPDRGVSLPQLEGSSMLTHSRMVAYKTCPRKHYFLYEQGIRRIETVRPLRIGGAVHKGLDVLGVTNDIVRAVAATEGAYDEVPDWLDTDEELYKWHIEQATVGALIEGYHSHFVPYGPLQTAGVVASEQSFSVPIRNPESRAKSRSFVFGGQEDGIVRLRDGRLALEERKTTSESLDPDSNYWRRLRIDQQISGYYCAAVDGGYPIQTVIYTVIRKPTVKPRSIPILDDDGLKIVEDANGERVYNGSGKPRQSASVADGYTLLAAPETPREFKTRLLKDIAARPDFYYARREIPRLKADLEEFRRELWQTAKLIKHSQRYGHWPRSTHACTQYNTLCPYFGICTDGIDMDRDNPPSGFKAIHHIHPELTGGNDAT